MKEVANKVMVRAQAFRLEVFMASMMASFEKKPDKKGIPVRAKLPTVRDEAVNGRSLWSPPIFRMSCSLSRLWMMEPEQRKSIALKKACVQIWRKAN